MWQGIAHKSTRLQDLVVLARDPDAAAGDRDPEVDRDRRYPLRPQPDMRRIMIERYRTGEAVQGIAAYLRDAGARRLDHDPDFGTLWHLDSADAGPMLLVAA